MQEFRSQRASEPGRQGDGNGYETTHFFADKKDNKYLYQIFDLWVISIKIPL